MRVHVSVRVCACVHKVNGCSECGYVGDVGFAVVGLSVGNGVALSVGFCDGGGVIGICVYPTITGGFVIGSVVGGLVQTIVGKIVGEPGGLLDGLTVGNRVGLVLGLTDGKPVGGLVGFRVGGRDGRRVGCTQHYQTDGLARHSTIKQMG